jgi:hypothetical protein
MTYKQILAEIEQLPQTERQALLLWLVRRARIESRRAGRRIPPASALRGIAKPAGRMPTDAELQEDYANYLAGKYLYLS